MALGLFYAFEVLRQVINQRTSEFQKAPCLRENGSEDDSPLETDLASFSYNVLHYPASLPDKLEI